MLVIPIAYLRTAMAATAGLVENWNGIDIHYKAVKATEDEDLFQRLQGQNGTIYDTQGEEIGTSVPNIFDGDIFNAVR